MTDDELERMCSYCASYVHPDDELHQTDRQGEPIGLCDFCWHSHAASAWCSGYSYNSDLHALGRALSSNANLLRADLRRFTQGEVRS